ncbi:MAG TPA: hypothetical protein VF070_27285 [Streptosporangiaceae bacterium]
MDDHSSWSSASARRPDPSWPTVIATTVRLWFERRHGRKVSVRLVLGLTIVAVIAIAAGTTAVMTQPKPRSATSQPASTAHPRSAPLDPRALAAIRTAAATRDQAAAWIAAQVTANAIVACDPAMCVALRAGGIPGGRLVMLGTAATDPLGSDLIVATPALRAEFGTRLTSVYAPTVIASFGAGAGRIDIRSIAPDGAAAYQAALRADQRARTAAGRQLLRNPRISVSADALASLSGGDVDPRLLITLAALAARQPVRIIAFGDPSPAADPGVPLRSAQIVPTRGGASSLRSMQSFLDVQRPPFLPGRSSLIRTVLTVQYGAPSPLGLLS